MQLDAPPNACILPGWVVTAVCEVPRGATPSYAHGYYERDNVFYRAWDQISRDRDCSTPGSKRHILKTERLRRVSAVAVSQTERLSMNDHMPTR